MYRRYTCYIILNILNAKRFKIEGLMVQFKVNSVCVYVCIYICICVCVCVYVYVCMYMCMCMCVYVCMYIYIYVCIYICVCVCVCVYICVYIMYIYIYIYIYMYVCVCVYIYIYILTNCNCIYWLLILTFLIKNVFRQNFLRGRIQSPVRHLGWSFLHVGLSGWLVF